MLYRPRPRWLTLAALDATQVYTEEEFQNHEMLITGEAVLKQFYDLAAYGKIIKADIEKKRIALLSIHKEKRIFNCPKCDYEVQQSDSFCPTCGHKLGRGVFA